LKYITVVNQLNKLLVLAVFKKYIIKTWSHAEVELVSVEPKLLHYVPT